MSLAVKCIEYIRKVNRPVPTKELRVNIPGRYTADSIETALKKYVKNGDLQKVPFKDKDNKKVKVAYSLIRCPKHMEANSGILAQCIDCINKHGRVLTIPELMKYLDKQETSIRCALDRGCARGMIYKTHAPLDSICKYAFGVKK